MPMSGWRSPPVDQVLRHLGGSKILDIQAAQVLLAVDVRIKIEVDYEAYGRDARINEGGHFAPGGYVQGGHSFTEHYHGLEDIGVLAAVHDGLKLCQLVLVQFRQHTGQMVQLVNALILAQVFMELGHTG